MKVILFHPSPTQGLRLQLALESLGLEVRRSTDAQALAVGHDPGWRAEAVVVETQPGGDAATALYGLGLPMLICPDAPPEEAAREVAARAAALTEPRLLLVDDSVTYRHYLRLELEAEGYRVDGAADAVHALKALETAVYECVIIDLVLPDIDGLQLATRLDEYRRYHDCIFGIVMLTSREDRSDLVRALDAGADDFVGKSDDPQILKARIRALLRRKNLCESVQRRQAAKGG